jgi:hypothetical protein
MWGPIKLSPQIPTQMSMQNTVGDVMQESNLDFQLSTDADCENSGFHLL